MSKYGHRPHNWFEAIVNKLGGEEAAERFLRDDVVVVIRECRIDQDADHIVPKGWTVEEHQKQGQFKWDPAKVALFLSESLKSNSVIEGHELRKELKGKRAANACLLNYLLANPHLIPEEWKGKYVFFWGSIYRDRDDALCVFYLEWGGAWGWGVRYRKLGCLWNYDDPAVLLVSN